MTSSEEEYEAAVSAAVTALNLPEGIASGHEVEITFEPQGDDLVISASLLGARFFVEFNPEDPEACAALSILMSGAPNIINQAVEAAYQEEE